MRLGRAARRLRPAWPPDLPVPDPPERTPGDALGPPAWVGIGAPRSGSTWWARVLGRHPRIPRRSKELHFFDPYFDRPFTDADVRAYHRHFPRSGDELPGEWTPGYLYQPWAVDPLLRAAPDARLLVILRDPVDQLLSSVNYSHTHHGAPANPLMVTRHLGEAAYHEHLAQWARRAPDRLLVLQFERCRDDPVAEVARTLEFLGLDPLPDGLALPRSSNAAEVKPLAFTDAARRAVAERLADDVRRLAAAFPDIDPGRWPSFRDL